MPRPTALPPRASNSSSSSSGGGGGNGGNGGNGGATGASQQALGGQTNGGSAASSTGAGGGRELNSPRVGGPANHAQADRERGGTPRGGSGGLAGEAAHQAHGPAASSPRPPSSPRTRSQTASSPKAQPAAEAPTLAASSAVVAEVPQSPSATRRTRSQTAAASPAVSGGGAGGAGTAAAPSTAAASPSASRRPPTPSSARPPRAGPTPRKTPGPRRVSFIGATEIPFILESPVLVHYGGLAPHLVRAASAPSVEGTPNGHSISSQRPRSAIKIPAGWSPAKAAVPQSERRTTRSQSRSDSEASADGGSNSNSNSKSKTPESKSSDDSTDDDEDARVLIAESDLDDEYQTSSDSSEEDNGVVDVVGVAAGSDANLGPEQRAALLELKARGIKVPAGVTPTAALATHHAKELLELLQDAGVVPDPAPAKYVALPPAQLRGAVALASGVSARAHLVFANHKHTEHTESLQPAALVLARKDAHAGPGEGYQFGRRMVDAEAYLQALEWERLLELAHSWKIAEPADNELGLEELELTDDQLVAAAPELLSAVSLADMTVEHMALECAFRELDVPAAPKRKKLADLLRPHMKATVMEAVRLSVKTEIIVSQLAPLLLAELKEKYTAVLAQVLEERLRRLHLTPHGDVYDMFWALFDHHRKHDSLPAHGAHTPSGAITPYPHVPSSPAAEADVGDGSVGEATKRRIDFAELGSPGKDGRSPSPEGKQRAAKRSRH